MQAYGTAHATFTVTVTAAPEPLSDFQLWLQAHNVATDTGAGTAAPNGYTYWQNYVADIDPSGDFLEIGFAATDGYLEIKNASASRYYELLVYEDLTADPVVFDLGAGSADMTEDFPVDDETFFVRVRALLEEP